MKTTSAAELSKLELAKYIDHTLLKPEATKLQIQNLCEEALKYNFYAVCINSSHLQTAKEILRKSQVKIASVVGFPLGACDSNVKKFEAKKAIDSGAHELDMVIHLGAIKSEDWLYVEQEIKDIILISQGQPVKVIFETHMLTDAEKIKLCQICTSTGVTFVKTSTGFLGGGATISDVQLMKSHIGPKVLVKASGGVRDYATAIAMIDAGASRIGTSAGVAIIEKFNQTEGY